MYTHGMAGRIGDLLVSPANYTRSKVSIIEDNILRDRHSLLVLAFPLLFNVMPTLKLVDAFTYTASTRTPDIPNNRT
jgi:hypothetical protein